MPFNQFTSEILYIFSVPRENSGFFLSMKLSADNQINSSFIDISRIKWLFFLMRSSFYRTTSTVGNLRSNDLLSTRAPSKQTAYQRHIKDNGYKSVFTNSWNRSWIKGSGKNPQKSELIHWRQCLLSGATEPCPLGLRETLACTGYPAQCHGHVWRVDTAPGKTRKKRNAC